MLSRTSMIRIYSRIEFAAIFVKSLRRYASELRVDLRDW